MEIADADHAVVLRRLVTTDEREAKAHYELPHYQNAIKRAIELLEDCDAFMKFRDQLCQIVTAQAQWKAEHDEG